MNHRIERSALIQRPAEVLFSLVDDVERYPEFLPWCAGARVVAIEGQSVIASLEVARGGVRQRFTTRNERRAPEEIRMQLVEGPFSRLEGAWRFRALAADACKVELSLEFGFGGSLTRLAFEKVFSEVAGTMVDAFCRRAQGR